MPFDVSSTISDNSLFRQQCYVNGAWVDASSGKTFEVHDPANGSLLGVVPDLSAEDARAAVEAAEAAREGWANMLASERAAILMEWHRLIKENTDDLAKLMTLECGKPLAESKGEVGYANSFVSWFAEEGRRIYGDTIPTHNKSMRIVVIKQPVGVVAAITPWNFPAAMITRKLAPGLAAGCPCIVKPAEQTPYTALALAELADRAGMPKGVFNVVTGDAVAVGKEITTNEAVRKISFTGSTEVGRILMKQAADSIKKVSFELGGNAPFIVFDDADINAAVEGAMVSKYRNNGQTCVCANRIFVQSGVYDEFAEKLAAKVKELKVGHGLDDGTTMGPLIEAQGLDKVKRHVSDAVEQGATVLVGGNEIKDKGDGPFFEPTILTGMTTGMAAFSEETFGPVAPLYKFETEDEVVAMANDTIYGLAAYFFSRDIGRVWRMSERLEYGMVGSNTGIMSNEIAPFGGVKQSGLGREGSRYGIEEYVETKYLCLGGI